MDITLEHLQQAKAAAAQRHQQALADLNGIIGEVRLLDALIAEAQKQPENPDLI